MTNLILKTAVAALAACSFAAPVLADSVTVTRERSYDRRDDDYYGRDRPGIIINDRGVSFGAVRDRDRYSDRCVTKTITRTNDDGDRVTKTVRRCD